MRAPDRPSARLALFGVALAAALGLGAAVGSAAGPIDIGGDPADHTPTTTSTGSDGWGDHGGHP